MKSFSWLPESARELRQQLGKAQAVWPESGSDGDNGPDPPTGLSRPDAVRAPGTVQGFGVYLLTQNS